MNRETALDPQDAKTSKAICLVSGGMDSCVCAALAQSRGCELAFLHVSYGQRTQQRERRAFDEIADHYRVKLRKVVSLKHLSDIGGSALTDPDIPVPAADLQRRGIPVSYVPFRNANMLSIAVSWAEILVAPEIYIGAVEEDSSGYPDCRQTFYDAFNRMIREGTRPGTQVVVRTPLIHINKAEIIRLGLRLGAPLSLTWSCYSGTERACGRCDSCALRLRAFAEAGEQDPIPYEDNHRAHRE